MFFEMVLRNSRRSKKENGIFFSSLVVSIIAFYIILSLETQDVMLFLKTMESDAVGKLLTLIPVLYGVTLFIIFFLVYFAGKYQLERRNHEFGICLMSGMRQETLFGMLLAEDLLGSVWALGIGIPLAILISEIISLVTARLVGLGIIGHRFQCSLSAVMWTVIGFVLVKLLSFLVLSRQIVKKEVGELLAEAREEKEECAGGRKTAVLLIAGIVLLGITYTGAIDGTAWRSVFHLGAAVLLGIAGTFALFHGLGSGLELFRKKDNVRGLQTFTFRQLQENIVRQPNVLAICSLLVLMAVCCFGYGISIGFGTEKTAVHTMDYTFEADGADVPDVLEQEGIRKDFKDLAEIRMGMFFAEDDTHEFVCDEVISAAERLPDVPEKETLVNNLGYWGSPYLIPVSDYNHLLELAGEKPLSLTEHQAVYYDDPERGNEELWKLMDQVLGMSPAVVLDGERYELLPNAEHQNLVVDRLITVSGGLIVNDKTFDRLIAKDHAFSYWNAVLRDDLVKKAGLMQAIAGVNEQLNRTSLPYESYLQNMGRQLFYMVASSYVTIYLAIIFLVIANTVMGVQFLMRQQKSGRRYQTLIHLGCDYEVLCDSAGTQIRWFFLCPVLAAVCSSIFGIRSLFTGTMVSRMNGRIPLLLVIAGAVTVLLLAVECLYVTWVKRISDRQILGWMEAKREE